MSDCRQEMSRNARASHHCTHGGSDSLPLKKWAVLAAMFEAFLLVKEKNNEIRFGLLP